VRWSSLGTNREVFMGIGPTGRETPITGIEIIEVREGRIVRRWGEWDINAHAGAAQIGASAGTAGSGAHAGAAGGVSAGTAAAPHWNNLQANGKGGEGRCEY
jgi:hypothetical protein